MAARLTKPSVSNVSVRRYTRISSLTGQGSSACRARPLIAPKDRWPAGPAVEGVVDHHTQSRACSGIRDESNAGEGAGLAAALWGSAVTCSD